MYGISLVIRAKIIWLLSAALSIWSFRRSSSQNTEFRKCRRHVFYSRLFSTLHLGEKEKEKVHLLIKNPNTQTLVSENFMAPATYV